MIWMLIAGLFMDRSSLSWVEINTLRFYRWILYNFIHSLILFGVYTSLTSFIWYSNASNLDLSETFVCQSVRCAYETVKSLKFVVALPVFPVQLLFLVRVSLESEWMNYCAVWQWFCSYSAGLNKSNDATSLCRTANKAEIGSKELFKFYSNVS